MSSWQLKFTITQLFKNLHYWKDAVYEQQCYGLNAKCSVAKYVRTLGPELVTLLNEGWNYWERGTQLTELGHQGQALKALPVSGSSWSSVFCDTGALAAHGCHCQLHHACLIMVDGIHWSWAMINPPTLKVILTVAEKVADASIAFRLFSIPT